MAETPVLQVEHLTMRYGEGCPHCKDHLEKTAAPFAALFGQQMIFLWKFILGKCWVSLGKAVPVNLH